MGNTTVDIPDTSPPALSTYAAATLKQRLERMLTYSKGVRSGDDVEAVHQMRVWARRTRAALEIFRRCLPGKEYAEIELEVKRMADALGEVRDLDVMIESLTKRADALPEPQRPGVLAFVHKLKHRRSSCQRAVELAVDRLERHDLAGRVDRLTAAMLPHSLDASAISDSGAKQPERNIHG